MLKQVNDERKCMITIIYDNFGYSIFPYFHITMTKIFWNLME